MKYIIPENKLDKVVFKYLDNTLKGLEKRKPKYYEGIIFAYPDEKHGILGYENNGSLSIYHELIDEISSGFGLDRNDSKSIIGRWASDRYQLASDRYQLEVINTDSSYRRYNYRLAIDTN